MHIDDWIFLLVGYNINQFSISVVLILFPCYTIRTQAKKVVFALSLFSSLFDHCLRLQFKQQTGNNFFWGTPLANHTSKLSKANNAYETRLKFVNVSRQSLRIDIDFPIISWHGFLQPFSELEILGLLIYI